METVTCRKAEPSEEDEHHSSTACFHVTGDKGDMAPGAKEKKRVCTEPSA